MTDSKLLQDQIQKLKSKEVSWPKGSKQINEIAVLIGGNISNPVERELLSQALKEATGAPKGALSSVIKAEVRRQAEEAKAEARRQAEGAKAAELQKAEEAQAEERRQAAEAKRRTQPDKTYEATERPIDLQAAELLFHEHDRLVAERSWSLFRYSADHGFWGIWPDIVP